MSAPDRRPPLLVTGAHRSGTTWVGKMLAAGGYAYISEPLNVWHRPGVMEAPVRYWYTYICHDNETFYLPAFQKMLSLRYGWLAELRALRSRRDGLRMGRDAFFFLRGRLLHQPPLVKDPFAVFSIPWFIERLGCQVVVTVRHPAAFASSLKRLNWPFDFKDLLAQPLLMRDQLERFRQDMEQMPADDVIGQAALLWKMIYERVRSFQVQFPGMLVVRHEDLSRHPLEGFARVYEALGMAYPARVQEVIRRSSSGENPGELSKRQVHSVRLNSLANLENWKRRLSVEEIARIREVTEEVAAWFYNDREWV